MGFYHKFMIIILLFLTIVNIVIKITDLIKIIKKINSDTLQYPKLYRHVKNFLFEIIFCSVGIGFLLHCLLL